MAADPLEKYPALRARRDKLAAGEPVGVGRPRDIFPEAENKPPEDLSKDELRRLRIRAKWRRRAEKIRNDPELREKERQRKKARNAANHLKNKERKKAFYYRNKERLNERRKQYAEQNRERQREVNRACYARKPDVIAVRASDDLRSGRIGLDEYNRRISEALARLDEETK